MAENQILVKFKPQGERRLIEAINIIIKVKFLKVFCSILFLIIEPINRPAMHKGTNAIVLAYSINDRKSFENIDFWFE